MPKLVSQMAYRSNIHTTMDKKSITQYARKRDEFVSWVKTHYGYKMGGGLWDHTMKKHLILAIMQEFLRFKGIDVFVDRMAIQNTLHGKKYYAVIYLNNNEDIDTPDFDYPADALEDGIMKAWELIK